MKLPEKPPAFNPGELLRGSREKIRLLLAPSGALKDHLLKANAQYPYWDKFKQLSVPEGVSAAEAWFALKMLRNSLRRELPFADKSHDRFHYFITPTMQSLLSKIDQYAAGNLSLTNVDFFDKKDERFVISSLMEEAIASSVLEGAVTTRKLAKEMLRRRVKPKSINEQMITNNYETILKIRTDWNKLPLTPNLIHEIHKSMTRNTLTLKRDEGRYRTTHDDVHVVGDDQTILYTPPVADKISAMVHELCDFANKNHEDENFIHPIVKGIVLHFWFSFIHPYVDGNGRTARAIFYWYVLSKNYWLFEFLSISRIILNQRKKYENSFLHTEYDECDLNYFMLHQLQCICKSVEDLKRYLNEKLDEVNQSKQILLNHDEINDRQRALLLYATRNPLASYTIRSHQSRCRVVYETARRDLQQLVTMGFFEMKRSRNTFRFYPKENIGQILKHPNPGRSNEKTQP